MLGELFIAIGVSLFSGADSAFVYDSLKEVKKEKTFKKVMGNIMAIRMLSLGLASMIGGLVAEKFGYGFVFYISAFFYFTGAFLLVFTKEPKTYKKVSDRKYFKHLKKGVSYVKEHVDIKKYILFYSIFGATNFMTFILLQPYLKEGGFSLTLVGFGVCGYFLFSGMGAFFADRISKHIKNDDKLLFLMFFIFVVLFILVSLVNVLVGMFFLFIMMFVAAIQHLIIENKVNNRANSTHRATILSIKNMGANAAYTVLAPIVGLVTDVYSLRIAILMIGIGLIIHFVYVLFLFRKAK